MPGASLIPTQAQFVNDLLAVNNAACERYRAIAARSRNAVLRYVLSDIARQKCEAHRALERWAQPVTVLSMAATEWPRRVMRIYATCEQEFDDDATDRLAARLLVAEQLLLSAVEDACRAGAPDQLSRELGDALVHFRAIPSQLHALGRYNQHPSRTTRS
ncbi:MAG: hypothetical protein ACR2RL_00055 [Gammaproteobacteria bacterium]